MLVFKLLEMLWMEDIKFVASHDPKISPAIVVKIKNGLGVTNTADDTIVLQVGNTDLMEISMNSTSEELMKMLEMIIEKTKR